MRIKEILNQHRRDFNATYECEHCGFEYRGPGYDDTNFHQRVVPKMKCKRCGRVAGDDYRALPTKYSEYEVV